MALPFILLKGLSFLPFGGFLKSPKIIIGIIIIAVLAFAYFKWKSSIEEAAYNAVFSEQAEQHLKNQQRELDRTQKLIEQSNKAVTEAQTRRENLLREIDAARQNTRNVAPEDNGPVSPVLSEALEFIRNHEKVRNPSNRSLGDKAKDVIDKAVEATGSVVSSGNKAIDAWKARSK
jgi:hypothetical protein